MKLFKTIIAILLVSGIVSSANEETKPGVTISYEKRQPSSFERAAHIGLGGGLAYTGASGLDTLETMKKLNLQRNLVRRQLGLKPIFSPWYYRGLGLPAFSIGAIYGTYTVANALFAKYYNSNWEWKVQTKNYEISRRPKQSSVYSKGTRETIQFPKREVKKEAK